MTAINQQSLGHQAIDDASNRSSHANGSKLCNHLAKDNSTRDKGSSTVNISWYAEKRLQAYESARNHLPDLQASEPFSDVKSVSLGGTSKPSQIESSNAQLSEKVSSMLSEVEQNIVSGDEPGYQFLVNVLNNYQQYIENDEHLQEVIRREQYFLLKRKPVMDSSEFQSYSQVLNQFNNIIERQQFSIGRD